MIKQLKKNFDKTRDYIYLAGPFFNDIQESWAMDLALTLRNRGYHIYAPVDEKFDGKTELKANDIFTRDIEWLLSSKIVLAQLDYPLEESKVLTILDQNKWRHRPISFPDSGTVWEMGYAFAKNIPVIGYLRKPSLFLNLMLAQGLTGYIEEDLLEPFQKEGIFWNLIQGWKGTQI